MQVNNRLLEGDDARRVIKKDFGLEMICEIGGMVAAHSIMQKGSTQVNACSNTCAMKNAIHLPHMN